MSTVHVLPVDDAVEHHVPGGLDGHGLGCADCLPGKWLALESLDGDDTECPCGPTPEHVPSEVGGEDGWLYTHHSLDGREQHEGASS